MSTPDPQAAKTNEPDVKPGGPIAWMATNSIAANLVMIVLIAGGLLFSTQVTQEVFPEFELDQVVVRVPYPGASPAEVEQGILLAIEDQVSGVDGVKKITSQAVEGVGTVNIELVVGSNRSQALQDVKNEVDRITTFPVEAEEPVVSLAERPTKVMSVLVHGDAPEGSLRSLTERVRDALLAHEDITIAELGAAKGYEIAVEIPSEQLRAFGLTLPGVASTISRAALELPAGEVRTSAGEILVRTQERRDLGAEFGDLPLVTTDGGAVVRARDIGEVLDGFAEDDIESTFNGRPAMEVVVNRVGGETPLAVASAVREVLEELRVDLPKTAGLAVWDDQSKRYEDRLDLLGRNAFLGLGLVLLLLGLFLEPRVAFWVTMGIVISVIGAFVVFPSTGATINMVSLFAFIVTLGIIVDDAIIVGENIFEMRQRGMPALQAAIQGTREIAGPVVFAVLTNIIAFMPLFFVPGSIGKIFRQIPAVVVSVFAISLIESLFILPAHLSHDREPGRIGRALAAPSKWVTRHFDAFSRRSFSPLVSLCLRNRYFVPALGLGLLALSIGVVGGGLIRSSFLPRIDSDVVTSAARLPVGVPISEARRVRAAVEAAVARTESDLGETVVAGVYSQIGATGGAANELSMRVELVPPSERSIGGIDFSRAWRAATGDVAGVESLTFNATRLGPGGSAIDVQLTGPDQNQLERAAQELSESLARYEGVSDLDDGTASGKRQLSLSLTPQAQSLGLDAQDVASQVRAAFFGAEALRQQRGSNEVKVLVRLPREERERLSTVEDLMLRTPTGGEIPLSVAAVMDEGRSYTSIDRRDGQRIIAVTGDVDPTVGDANVILESVRENDLAGLQERYEGLGYSFEGEQESRRESLSALGFGMIFAVFSIFAMLAIPLKSYTLPLIVLSGAPFGIIGALLGHFILGYGLSLMSMFGIIALTGVVVNDSLVLVVTANSYRERGMGAFEAMHQAAVRRLRPIMLTSLTTSLGLLPMMLETSAQARFLVPMAISLGFGVLFSTLVILLLVPSLYLIREDLIDIARVARGGEARGQGHGAASPEITPELAKAT
jgi:multidrug efflux pump subunit AcrB